MTVTLPPPDGTVAEPVELDVPLFTAAWMVAPPQALGRLLTVTLTTELPERLLVTVVALVVQRGTLTLAAPSVRVDTGSDDARPTARPARTKAAARATCPAAGRKRRVVTGKRTGSYPLITTLTPVTAAAPTAGLNVAENVVPLDGVVPVASPSDVSLVPDRVTL